VEDFFATIEELWPAGREDYHWHVLPGSELVRDRIARSHMQITQQAGLAPVAAEYLHVTVQHLAPVSEITTTQLDQITGLVRDRCALIAPFAVTIGRAEAWEHGVVCPVRPGYLPATLWQVTTSAFKDVTGNTMPVRPAVFHPHLALAYATGHVDSGQVRAQLADSDAPEVAVPVTGLALVAQRHDRREITFRILDQVPLAG
jgi:2'-5' RNA ligase